MSTLSEFKEDTSPSVARYNLHNILYGEVTLCLDNPSYFQPSAVLQNYIVACRRTVLQLLQPGKRCRLGYHRRKPQPLRCLARRGRGNIGGFLRLHGDDRSECSDVWPVEMVLMLAVILEFYFKDFNLFLICCISLGLWSGELNICLY